MSEEPFTMDDAENDGKIKREAGATLSGVLKRDGSELYAMFMQVCDDKGLEPEDVLGDGILKAIKDEGFADMIASVDVNMSAVKAGEIRREDAKLLKDFADELGISPEDDTEHWLKDTVKNRMETAMQSPLDGISGDAIERNGANPQLQQQVRQLQSQVSQLNQELSDSKVEDTGNGDGEQSLDDIFEDEESGGEVEEVDGTDNVNVEIDEDEESDGGIMADVATVDEQDDSVEDDNTTLVSSEDGVEDE